MTVIVGKTVTDNWIIMMSSFAVLVLCIAIAVPLFIIGGSEKR